MDTLCNRIAALLNGGQDWQATLEQALQLVLAEFQSETATIHRLDFEKQQLHLESQVGLPPSLVDTVKLIPVGKGIAGQTVERGKPVTVCNLQTDTSGVAQPGALQSGLGGALCVPLRHGESVVGTFGIGTIRQYEYTTEETLAVEEVGRLFAAYLS